MAKKAPKGPPTLYDKVKAVDEDFVNAVYTYSDEQLNEKLSEMAKTTSFQELERDADQDLKSLKEQANEAAKTYSLPLNALKLKRKLIYSILAERGKAP